MKKIINVKPKKSLIENLIETAIKVGDKDYEKKLRKRVVDLSRARDLAKGALKRAEENGQTDVAEKLKTRIEEIDTLLATYNTDTIDDDPVGGEGATGGGEEDENSSSGSDQDVEDENDPDEQNKPGNGNASDDEGSDEQSDNQNGKEDGDDSESDDAQKNGQKGKDNEEDNDQSNNQGQGQSSEENDDNAEDKTGSGENAEDDQNDNKKADNQDGAGENSQSDSESDDSADDSSISNDIGSSSDSDDQSKDEKSSKNSQDDDSQNKNSSGSNGSSSNNSENEDEASDQNSNGGEDSESDSQGQSNTQQDSEGGDGDENEDESADDSSDNGQNSKNQQDANSQKPNNSSQDKKDSQDKSSSKPSLDQDDSNDDGESEFQNPFADDDDISSNGGLPTGGTPPREATKDETIELLGTLTGEGREGAKDALKELIAKRKAATPVESFKPLGGQSLTEAVKSVRDMTDDEFGDYINDTYDLIDKADPVSYVDDIEDRKKKVGNWSQDPNVLQDIFGDDDLEIQKDYQKKKAREIAKARYSSISGLEDFQMDFYAAIHNQVETIKQEYQTYDEINTEYESEDVIMKADAEKELPAEAKPIIDVYFDVSGSWEESDIKIGEAAIASVKVFEDQGDIVLNVFYFSDDVDNVSMQHCRDTYGYGTHGWPKILQNIKATDAKNVLIMTDDDFERLSQWGDADSPKMNGSLTVDGCVWYLWKNGAASPCCLSKLKGRQGTQQYGFRA
jgi:hypothetical protein